MIFCAAQAEALTVSPVQWLFNRGGLTLPFSRWEHAHDAPARYRLYTVYNLRIISVRASLSFPLLLYSLLFSFSPLRLSRYTCRSLRRTCGAMRLQNITSESRSRRGAIISSILIRNAHIKKSKRRVYIIRTRCHACRWKILLLSFVEIRVTVLRLYKSSRTV